MKISELLTQDVPAAHNIALSHPVLACDVRLSPHVGATDATVLPDTCNNRKLTAHVSCHVCSLLSIPHLIQFLMLTALTKIAASHPPVQDPRPNLAAPRHPSNELLDGRLHDPYQKQSLSLLPLHYQPSSQHGSTSHFEQPVSIRSSNRFPCEGTEPCYYEKFYQYENEVLKQKLENAENTIYTLQVQLQNSKTELSAPQRMMACENCSQKHVDTSLAYTTTC
jgi:hypothetical protein